jgi:hypothetical protein
MLIALLGTVAALSLFRGRLPAVQGATPQAALVGLLAREGLTVEPEQVVWLANAPNALGLRPVLLVGHRDGELSDVYFAYVRLSGDRAVDVRLLTNVSRTSSADETQLTASLPMVAYAAQVGAVYDAVVVLDTRGEPAALTQGWPLHARAQNAITNLQDTGRARAFGTRRYNFLDAPKALRLGARKHGFDVVADGRSLVINPWHDEGGSAAAFDVEATQKGRPGLITWAVDTVRRLPGVGAGPIEWLEHTVFGFTDTASRAYHGVVATDTAAEVKEALAVKELPPQTEQQAEQQASIGWPPPPVEPVLEDRVQGEGVWLPIVDDAFVADNPGGPPLFYQTFVRVDPERTFTRVYLTAWDSRQVQLGIVMGTKEPESATGETGSGQVPRDPQVLSRLVGGFNGGFQALHGEFGMMAERRVYLPPKPYAATVAVFEDGRVGVGSWTGPGRRDWDEEVANAQIPPTMIAMRQNLTSVVEDGVYNPWERWWWGAAPTWAEEQTYIPRSGLCLTGEGALIYLWGESMGPEELGKAMLAARCVRGLHLDMNGKHTGFELYRTFGPGASMPPLGRALASTEAEGPIEGMAGYQFRTRLAVTTMTPVRFPRYIDRDPRDYFYLLRKPQLPGAPLDVGGQRAAFDVHGLPDVGFPAAFAQARLGDAGAVITRIDATRAMPRRLAKIEGARVLATVGGFAREGVSVSLFARYQHGRLRLDLGRAPKAATVLATGTMRDASSSSLGALGVDGEGFLVHVQASSAAEVTQALQAAGVTKALALDSDGLQLTAAPVSTAVPDGGVPGMGDAQQADESDETLVLVENTQPAAEVLFPAIKPMPYRRWGYLQDQRVRYFPTHAARFPTPAAVR